VLVAFGRDRPWPGLFGHRRPVVAADGPQHELSEQGPLVAEPGIHRLRRHVRLVGDGRDAGTVVPAIAEQHGR